MCYRIWVFLLGGDVMKYITIQLFETDAEGNPDKTYVQRIEKTVSNPQDYVVTNYTGTGASVRRNRIRFIDGDNKDLNAQRYYEPLHAAFTSKLVYDEMTNPLFQNMVGSLNSVFANPQGKAMMIAGAVVVALVGVMMFLG